MKNRVRAIIFDLGGVLISWNDDTAFRKAADLAGIPFRKMKRLCEQEIFKFHKGLETETDFWRNVLKKAGRPDAHILRKLDHIWYREYSRQSRIDLRVFRIMKKLHKTHKIGIISNLAKIHDLANRRRKYFRHFRYRVLSYKVGMLKPKAGIYRLAARNLGLKPQECLFIDDKPVNVKGARKAGMKGIVFRGPAQLRQQLKKHGISV